MAGSVPGIIPLAQRIPQTKQKRERKKERNKMKKELRQSIQYYNNGRKLAT
jgi:hypothetical protein